MNKSEIKHIVNRHCRFKLRSGKEIYGVMCEKDAGTDFFFVSYAEMVKAGRDNLEYLSGSKVNIDEVICAQPIEE